MDPLIASTTTTVSGPNFLPLLNIVSSGGVIYILQSTIASFFTNILRELVPFSIFFSLLFLVGIVYTTLMINRIRGEEYAFYKNEIEKAKGAPVSGLGHNPKWERAMTNLESSNPSDWRLAILEADIILEEMVAGMLNLYGDNLGEKLRSVERSDFTTIDKAWEAHKVRNQIAHEGADFLLSQREARRILALYRDVFNEFHYI